MVMVAEEVSSLGSAASLARHERHQWWIKCDHCSTILGEQLTLGDVFWRVPNVLASGGPIREHHTVCPDCHHIKHYEIGLHLKKQRRPVRPELARLAG